MRDSQPPDEQDGQQPIAVPVKNELEITDVYRAPASSNDIAPTTCHGCGKLFPLEELTWSSDSHYYCSDCFGVPPARDRDRKLGPLGLAVLTLFCNVLLIPSVMALTRAFADIDRLYQREKEGVWTPEHETVRTQAVWGLIILVGYVMIFVLEGITTLYDFESTLPDEDGFVIPETEIEQIIEHLSSNDEQSRNFAVMHLREVIPTLSTREQQLAWDVVRDETEWSKVAAPGRALLLRAALQNASPQYIEAISSRYVELSGQERSAVLWGLAKTRSEESLDALAKLIRNEPPEEEPLEQPLFPLQELASVTHNARGLIAQLLDLPDDNPFMYDIRSLALHYCTREDGPRVAIDDPNGRLLSAWQELRLSLEAASNEGGTAWLYADDYQEPRAMGALLLDLLGCLSSADVERALDDALELHDPQLQLFALRALLRQNRQPPQDTVAAVAAVPETRVQLYRFLEERSMIEMMPERYRSPISLAESHMVGWLSFPTELGRPPDHIEHMGTETRDGAVYHLFRFRLENDERGWLAGVVGPFETAETVTAEAPRHTFSNFEPWSADSRDNIIDTLRRWEAQP